MSGKLAPGVYALSVSAFAIGVAEFIVVGILPALAQDLSVSTDTASNLVSLYALALAIGTPFIAALSARLPRKGLLITLMAIFMAGNLLAAISTSFAALLFGRVLTALAHGSFFAVGATVAAGMAPKGQAGRAISMMFAGLTLAMVVGVPLGSYLGNLMGWRLPFFAVAGLALAGIAAMAVLLPKDLPAGEGGRLVQQIRGAAHPAILAMMAVTILGFGASFAAFTFVTPLLTEVAGFSVTAANALLVVFGLATFAGNLAGGRLVGRMGWMGTLAGGLVLLALTLAALPAALLSPTATVLLLFVWGAAAFGLSPALQAGMLATAQRYTPAAVDFASGLNISAFNLGISLGTAAGAWLVAGGQLALTPYAGAAIAPLAVLPLLYLNRRNTVAASKTLKK
ncbi:MFS transporter [Rhodobacteraceae bacterium CH30]|nr:MFS transporter [Rhodobacteraceae bacterium CH30]